MDDLQMMMNPGTWPLWPLLPLKKRTGESGFLMETIGDPNRILFVEKGMAETTADDLSKAPDADAERLLAEGWLVD